MDGSCRNHLRGISMRLRAKNDRHIGAHHELGIIKAPLGILYPLYT